MADEIRLLHRNIGYTDRLDRALRAEPEAISRQAQEELAARARQTAHEAQLAEWEQRRQAVARELSWLYSQRLHRDVRAQLRTVQRQLDRLDRKLSER